MNWFIEIFEETSDKARLITTVIAAIIAVSVVLINQWFNSKRARKETLIEKVEEMYSEAVVMKEISMQIQVEIIKNLRDKDDGLPRIYKVATPVQNTNEKIEKLNKDHLRLSGRTEMLAGLYFPSLSENLREVRKNYNRRYVSFLDSSSYARYENKTTNSLEEMELIFDSIFDELTKIMNKTMH